MTNIIKITSGKKYSSMRVSEATKKELESLGHKGETHEEIINKLIKLVKNAESDTEIIKRNNMLGTKYARLSRTFNIDIDNERYDLVCTYNDLTTMAVLARNRNLQAHFGGEWEIDLEIVNIGIKRKLRAWQKPNDFQKSHPEEYKLLYLIAVKQLLEDIFSIKIYELTNTEDFLNYDKWREVYKRNNLSMESFYKDVEKKLK